MKFFSKNILPVSKKIEKRFFSTTLHKNENNNHNNSLVSSIHNENNNNENNYFQKLETIMTQYYNEKKYKEVISLYETFLLTTGENLEINHNFNNNHNFHFLVLESLKKIPHRAHQYNTLSTLLFSENNHHNVLNNKNNIKFLKISNEENFRIRFFQNINLLKSCFLLNENKFGLLYLLSEMHFISENNNNNLNVLNKNNNNLKDIELNVLLFLSKSVLAHKNTFFNHNNNNNHFVEDFNQNNKNNTEKIDYLSPFQQQKLIQMETNLWKELFIFSQQNNNNKNNNNLVLKAFNIINENNNWDKLLFSKIAENIIFPPNAFQIFPNFYKIKRNNNNHKFMTTDDMIETKKETLKTIMKNFQNKKNENNNNNLENLKQNLQKRPFPSILVPDIQFLFSNFDASLNYNNNNKINNNNNLFSTLGKCRTIIISHYNFLLLVKVASDVKNKKRFRAREILLFLMTHSFQFENNNNKINNQNNIYLMSLSEEIALLSSNPQREHFSKINHHYNTIVQHSSVFVASALESLLFRPENKNLNNNNNNLENEVEDVISAILQNHSLLPHENIKNENKNNNIIIPLFRSRSRRYWSSLHPLLLCTADPRRREVGQQAGVALYPPVE